MRGTGIKPSIGAREAKGVRQIGKPYPHPGPSQRGRKQEGVKKTVKTVNTVGCVHFMLNEQVPLIDNCTHKLCGGRCP